MIPTHWSVIVGEDSLMVKGSLKKSLEISNIYIHPQYETNAPTYEFPSDYDVGELTERYAIRSYALSLSEVSKINLYEK